MKTKNELLAIRSEAQYRSYLAKVDHLMDNDPSPNSDEGRLLETLAILIEAYEKNRGWELPMIEDPIDLIKKRMEDLDLRQADLTEVMGDKSVVSKVLSRTRKLTYSMINPLSELLRVPPELLLEKK